MSKRASCNKELLKREVLHADETTLQVLHEAGKAAQSKSFMWLYRTSGNAGRPIVLYEHQPGRGAGYHGLPEDITVVGCWAHARRKFDKAMKALPKGKAKTGSAAQGLAYCSLLFKIEEELAGLSPEEWYKQRLGWSHLIRMKRTQAGLRSCCRICLCQIQHFLPHPICTMCLPVSTDASAIGIY